MRRSISLALALLTALSLVGCLNVAKARMTVTQSAEHVAGAGLVVKTRNGGVKVVAVPGRSDVAIEARITCAGADQAEADARLAAAALTVKRGPDRTLEISPSFPGGPRNGDGASITIELPDATGVEIHTSNGPVTAHALSGKLVIDTSNGPVEVVMHQGPAQIDTSNGPITVTDHVGALVADTSNGPIRVSNLDGSARADTSNGPITLTLAAGQAGPLHLDTSNGSIKVGVGPAFAGTVVLDTSNGRISIQDRLGRVTSQKLSRDHARIVVGEGEGAGSSRIDTSNGRIVFTIDR